jgi:prefoldin subunit 5
LYEKIASNPTLLESTYAIDVHIGDGCYVQGITVNNDDNDDNASKGGRRIFVYIGMPVGIHIEMDANEAMETAQQRSELLQQRLDSLQPYYMISLLSF